MENKLKKSTTLKKFTPSVFFHPGDTLSEKLNEMGMSIKEFALRTNKPEKTVIAVINGKSSITPDMAAAFEMVTDITMRFWMNAQCDYDEYLTRRRKEEELQASCEWVKKFPISQMARMGWIEPSKNMNEMAVRLLNFFKVSSVAAWHNLYFEEKLLVAFRISLKQTKDPYAISAWLCRGEHQFNIMNVQPYSESSLKKALPSLKEVMISEDVDFAGKIQRLCASVGVKVAYTPCLANAPIKGATRWIKGVPCIQLSNRQKREDMFWFTFFHEIGHILLHGKKNIFIDGLGSGEVNEDRESQADKFASSLLLSEVFDKEFASKDHFSDKVITDAAERYNTLPSIVVGRLQHLGKVPYSHFNFYVRNIELFAKEE